MNIIPRTVKVAYVGYIHLAYACEHVGNMIWNTVVLVFVCAPQFRLMSDTTTHFATYRKTLLRRGTRNEAVWAKYKP